MFLPIIINLPINEINGVHMERGKTIQLILVCAVVLLLVLNVFQFMVSSNDGVKQEDVPIQIADLKGDDWESLVGETVTVEGYYVKNNGMGMLISDPYLTQIRRPLNTSEFLRIDNPLPDDATQFGKYLIKGEVFESADVDEKVYLGTDKYSLELLPLLEPPFYIIDVPMLIPPEHSATKYAVLISGGVNSQNAWPSFWNDLVLVYSVLVQDYSYDPANIFVIYNDGVGADGQIPVDCSASAAHITTILNNLSEVMTTEDTFFFYATDHGTCAPSTGNEPSNDQGNDEYISLWHDVYRDDQLNTNLYNIKCEKAIIILDLCYSGGFTWDLKAHSNRIIMTACLESQGAVDNPNFPNGDFTYNLIHAFQKSYWGYDIADMDFNGKVSLAEAFNFAAITSVSCQTPTYDDNGDGVSHSGFIPNGGVSDDGRLGNTYL